MSFSNDGTLKVGGWSVSQDGLESMEEPATWNMRRAATVAENTAPKAFLSAKGRRVQAPSNAPWNDKSIVFKAGDNFVVDEDGGLYANSGVIGGWTMNGQTGYSGGLYHDTIIGDTDEKYRFGMKIEDGSTERFAWYVRKFYNKDEEEPSGDIIFGVKFNGEIIATKGKIGSMEIAVVGELLAIFASRELLAIFASRELLSCCGTRHLPRR